MPQISAGLVMYRHRAGVLEVLLVHPGGPFFRNKDDGAWSIPKGLVAPGEDALAAARREFHEETGFASREPFVELLPCRLRSGKVVRAWAFEGDADPGELRSNTFELEWPPRSGKMQRFPEVDRAAFFDVQLALQKINAGQRALVVQLSSCKLQDEEKDGATE